MANSAKDSDGHIKFFSMIQKVMPGVRSLDDVVRNVEKYSRESHGQIQLIKALQMRCEEAEIARDLLQEKERILLEDQQDATAERQKCLELHSEVKILQTELERLALEKEQVTVRISQKEDEVMQLAHERSKLIIKLDQAQKMSDPEEKLDKVKNLYENLRLHMAHREKVIDKKRAQLKIANQLVSQLKNEKVVICGHRSRQQKKLDEVWKKFHEQRIALESVKKEKDLLKTGSEGVEQLLTSNAEELSMLHDQLLQQHKITGEQSTRIKELETQIKTLQDEPEQLVKANKDQLAKVQQEVIELRQDCSRSDTEHRLLCGRYDETAGQLSAAKAELFESQQLVDTLENELVSIKTSMEDRNREHEALSVLNNETKKALGAVREELALLQSKFGEVKEKLAAREADLQRCNDELEGFQRKYRKLSTNQDEQLIEAREEFEKYKYKYEQSKSAADNAASELASKTKVLGDMKIRIMELEQELVGKDRLLERTVRNCEDRLLETDRGHEKTLRALKEEAGLCVQETIQRLKAKEEDCEQLSRSIVVLQKELQDARQLVTQLETNETKATNDRLDTLQTQLREAVSYRERLESTLESMAKEKESSENSLQAALEGLSAYSVQIKNLQAELEDSNEKFSTLTREFERYQEHAMVTETNTHMRLRNLEQECQAHMLQVEEKELLLSKEVESRKVETVNLLDLVTIKEAEWTRERAELSAWLNQQQEELQHLSIKARQMESTIDTSISTAEPQLVVTSADATDLVESAEMVQLKKTMKDMLKSIREEHNAILTVWHNLGERIYRDSFYQRV
jgi:myosin protein heavy chain